MKNLLTISMLIFIGISSAGATDTVVIDKLSDAIKLAFTNNTDIINGQLDVRIKQLQIKEVTSGGFPQVNATGKILDNLEIPTSVFPAEALGGPSGILWAKHMGVNYNVDGSIFVKQILFDQSFFAGIKMAGSAEKLSQLSLRKIKEDVILELASTYYNALLNGRQSGYLKKQLESNLNLIKIAETQFKTGVIKKSDLGRLQVNQTNLETELEYYENLAARQINELKLIIGVKGSSILEINDSIPEQLLFTTRSDTFDIDNRTDWKIAEAQEELQNLEIRQLKARAMPSLSIGAQLNGDLYGTEPGNLGNDLYHSSSVYLMIDVPIFDGFKRNAQLAHNRIDCEKLKNSQSLLESTVDVEISNAKMELDYNIKQLQSQKKNQELADEVYQESTVEYNNGTASLSDLLNSENSLLQSQRQYLRALANKLLAEFDLKKAQGKLLQSFSVE